METRGELKRWHVPITLTEKRGATVLAYTCNEAMAKARAGQWDETVGLDDPDSFTVSVDRSRPVAELAKLVEEA